MRDTEQKDEKRENPENNWWSDKKILKNNKNKN